MTKIIILILVVLFSLTSFASISKDVGQSSKIVKKSKKNKSVVAKANKAPVKVSQKNWTQQMKKNLSHQLCQKGEFFRECYKIDQNKCIQTVKSATDQCLGKINLPLQISEHKQAKQYGLKVGSCVGSESQESLQSRKIMKVACSDPQKW